ncbi:hypothetical protein OS189_08820 [Sulfitobacter sp. F26169L]|uniref:hypothetical protein n=1 Tax=Sulfitobacter sp. F26169L TaxID=2996015 RepID=UPI002260E975|nr:hypothetical protein [Sulfitobacter sp. F26169L]MCX7566442.1 hypothetical protein [Sulfitobacter sp. F26169L]
MIRAFFPAAICAAVTLLGACTDFPALDRTITPELSNADYPALVPLEPVLAAAQSNGVEPVQANAAIDRRVAALKARAARLRGSVLSGAERQRLKNGLR